MSILERAFRTARERQGEAIVPFVVAGDPGLERSREIILALARSGATAIEVGVPFSDPVADGPTIQRASERALRGGVSLSDVLALTRQVSAQIEVPLVLFTYLNPLLRYGVKRLCSELPACGIRGVLITDLPHEESSAMRAALSATGVDLIALVAPTTSDSRLQSIAAEASGFIYAISRSGVTGAERASSDARSLVQRIRKFTQLPIAVGFGVATAAQVTDVCSYADAAVVGSALVSQIEQYGSSPQLVTKVEEFISSLQSSEVQHVSRNA